MDRAAQLRRLAERLESALAARDWAALAEGDRALCALLRQAAAGAAWTAAERPLVARLRRAHRAAASLCTAEARHAGSLLKEMRERRDAWLAYAAAGKAHGSPA